VADLLVSYAREDTAFVRRLVDGLAARGKDAWVDAALGRRQRIGTEDEDDRVRVIDRIPDGVAPASGVLLLSRARTHVTRCLSRIERVTFLGQQDARDAEPCAVLPE
jgi:hypothetical protein